MSDRYDEMAKKLIDDHMFVDDTYMEDKLIELEADIAAALRTVAEASAKEMREECTKIANDLILSLWEVGRKYGKESMERM